MNNNSHPPHFNNMLNKSIVGNIGNEEKYDGKSFKYLNDDEKLSILKSILSNLENLFTGKKQVNISVLYTDVLFVVNTGSKPITDLICKILNIGKFIAFCDEFSEFGRFTKCNNNRHYGCNKSGCYFCKNKTCKFNTEESINNMRSTCKFQHFDCKKFFTYKKLEKLSTYVINLQKNVDNFSINYINNTNKLPNYKYNSVNDKADDANNIYNKYYLNIFNLLIYEFKDNNIVYEEALDDLLILAEKFPFIMDVLKCCSKHIETMESFCNLDVDGNGMVDISSLELNKEFYKIILDVFNNFARFKYIIQNKLSIVGYKYKEDRNSDGMSMPMYTIYTKTQEEIDAEILNRNLKRFRKSVDENNKYIKNEEIRIQNIRDIINSAILAYFHEKYPDYEEFSDENNNDVDDVDDDDVGDKHPINNHSCDRHSSISLYIQCQMLSKTKPEPEPDKSNLSKYFQNFLDENNEICINQIISFFNRKPSICKKKKNKNSKTSCGYKHICTNMLNENDIKYLRRLVKK